MKRYYNTNFDYSQAQRVESIGTSAYMVWRTTWECAGMFDEPLGQFMVDPAYNFTFAGAAMRFGIRRAPKWSAATAN